MIRVDQIRAARIRGEELLRDQRPCTLTWNDGASSVLAREGLTQEGLELPLGGAMDKKSCRFYVLKSLMVSPPAIGTTLALDGRDGEEWELDKVSGRSPSDIVWTLQCVEVR